MCSRGYHSNTSTITNLVLVGNWKGWKSGESRSEGETCDSPDTSEHGEPRASPALLCGLGWVRQIMSQGHRA